MKKGKPIKKVLRIIDKQLIDEILKQLDKDFGKKSCGEFNPECAMCMGTMLKGYLEWYRDLMD